MTAWVGPTVAMRRCRFATGGCNVIAHHLAAADRNTFLQPPLVTAHWTTLHRLTRKMQPGSQHSSFIPSIVQFKPSFSELLPVILFKLEGCPDWMMKTEQLPDYFGYPAHPAEVTEKGLKYKFVGMAIREHRRC